MAHRAKPRTAVLVFLTYLAVFYGVWLVAGAVGIVQARNTSETTTSMVVLLLIGSALVGAAPALIIAFNGVLGLLLVWLLLRRERHQMLPQFDIAAAPQLTPLPA